MLLLKQAAEALVDMETALRTMLACAALSTQPPPDGAGAASESESVSVTTEVSEPPMASSSLPRLLADHHAEDDDAEALAAVELAVPRLQVRDAVVRDLAVLQPQFVQRGAPGRFSAANTKTAPARVSA